MHEAPASIASASTESGSIESGSITLGMDGDDLGSFSLEEENLGFRLAFEDERDARGRPRVRFIRYPRGERKTDEAVMENVRRLVEHDQVLGLVNWGGPLSMWVARYAQASRVAHLFPHTALIDSTGQRYLFTSFPRYESEVGVMMRHLVQARGMKRIGVIHDPNPYGQVFLTHIHRHGADLGYTVAGAASVDSRNPSDLQPLLAGLLAEQPDVVFMALYPAQAQAVMRAKSALGWRGRMVCAGPLTDEQYLNMPDDSAEGTLGFCYYPDPERSDEPGVVAYRARMQRHHPGRPLNRYSLYGHAFGRLILAGLDRAGPSPTRESLIDGLESLRDWDCGGVMPPVSFSPDNHHAQRAGFIGELRQRRIEPLTPWIEP